MGFNPTDDGFILAGSRRLLEGQVPHRDFISIRPVGSCLLHAPECLWGGEYTFWISRYVVWLQFAAIAAAWTALAERLAAPSWSVLERWIAAWTAFALSSHFHPVMAWHSIDALFLTSLGLLGVFSRDSRYKGAGYFLVGAASLCRQNFLLMIPVSLLLGGDLRKRRFWAASLAPLLGYAAFLLWGGALRQGLAQMLSLSGDLASVGLARYAAQPAFYAGIAGGGVAAWSIFSGSGRDVVSADGASGQPSAGHWKIAGGTRAFAGGLALYGLTLYAAYTLRRISYLEPTSFLLFGAATGAAGVLLLLRGSDGPARAGLLACFAAWSVSVSIGYNTPAFANGPLALFLLACAALAVRRTLGKGKGRLAVAAGGLLLAVLATFQWQGARREIVYRDLPEPGLTHPLGDVLPGGRRLWTNANTRAFLADLQTAVEKAQGDEVAVVPDAAGYWACAPRRNPLPVDWVQVTELNNEALVERFTDAVERGRGRWAFLVQKAQASRLARGFVPLEGDPFYAPVDYIRSRFQKVGETSFFEIYR